MVQGRVGEVGQEEARHGKGVYSFQDARRHAARRHRRGHRPGARARVHGTVREVARLDCVMGAVRSFAVSTVTISWKNGQNGASTLCNPKKSMNSAYCAAPIENVPH